MERAATEPDERRPVPSAVVLAIGVASVVGALLAAWLVYRELIRYEPRAALHLLPGTASAARLDVERVVVFEPVRRHLLPLVNVVAPVAGPQVRDSSALESQRERPDRLRALREAHGIELGRDLRELVLSSSESGDWMVALGGLFPQRGVVTAIERVLRDEGAQALECTGSVLVLSPGGVAIGQASDGVLVIASSREAVESALPENDIHARIGMPLEGAGSLVLTGEPLRRWQDQTSSAEALPGPLRVTLHIERPLRLELTAGSRDPAPLANALASARRSVSFTSPSANLPIADSGAERALLARARVVADAGQRPKIVTFMERAELESALAWLAARAERDLASRPGGR